MAKEEMGLRQKLAALRQTVTAPWAEGRELIEIRQAILDEVGERVVGIGDGKRIFPYNHLRLHLFAKTADEQIVTAAAVAAWDLAERVRERLAEARCPVTDLTVEPLIVGRRTAELRERPYFVEYQRVDRPEPGTELPWLELIVQKGKTPHRVNRFRKKRVLLGRLEVVLDENGSPKRRNDLAFDDEGEVNQTVGRAHARIEYRPESRSYYLVDERSSSGTNLFRDSRTIKVPSRDKQGIRLQPGDLISLGRAEVSCNIRFEKATETEP